MFFCLVGGATDVNRQLKRVFVCPPGDSMGLLKPRQAWQFRHETLSGIMTVRGGICPSIAANLKLPARTRP